MSVWFKWLKSAIFAVASLLLFITLLIAFLLFTPAGLNISASITNMVLASHGIKLEGKLQGTILNFSVPKFYYSDQDSDIIITNVHINPSFFTFIWRGRIDIHSLSADKVDVNIKSNDTSQQGDSPFSMPMPLKAQNISVALFSYGMDGKSVFNASAISINRLQIIGDRLDVGEGSLSLLSAKNTRKVDNNHEMKLSLNSGYIILNSPFNSHFSLSGHTRINGNTIDAKQIIVSGNFDQVFDIETRGIVTLKKQKYPFHSHSVFDYPSIITTLDINDDLSSMLHAQLNLDFKNKLDWSLQFTDGDRNNKISTSGTFESDDSILSFNTNSCELTLGSQTLQCQLQLKYAHNQLQIPIFSLQNQHNKDHVNINDFSLKLPDKNAPMDFSINWEAAVVNLKSYDSQIAGSLNSSGYINYKNNTLQTDLMLQADKIDYRSHRLESLSLAIDPNNRFSLSMMLANSVTRINATVDATDFSDLSLLINTIQVSYSGRIWQSEKPATLAWQKSTLSLTPLCLKNDDNNFICTNFTLSDSNQHFSAVGKLNPDIYAQLTNIKHSTSIVSFDATYENDDKNSQSGTLNIHASPGQITFSNPWLKTLKSNVLDSERKMIINAADFTLKLNQQTAGVSAIVDIPNNNFTANFTATDVNFKQLDRAKIKGNSQLSFTELGWISRFFGNYPTQINSGKLEGKLSLNGRLLNPDINGKLTLTEGNIEILQLNSRVDHINAELNITPPLNAKFKLTAEIDKQPLKILGSGAYNQGKFKSQITIKGQSLSVVNTPGLKLVITPDLIFTIDNLAMNLGGTVLVNKLLANIEALRAASLQNTIKYDVIYSDAQINSTPKSLPLRLNLNIDLGDEAKLSGLGVTTNILGNLDITSLPNKPMLAQGIIRFKNGVFSAYGKNFTIGQDSQIIYNESPIENPNLAIKSYYTIPVSVKLTQPDAPDSLGIEITGTARAPKLALFSNPMLSQNDILSYILFGKSLSNENSSQDSSDALSQAALLFALNEGGTGIINELKSRLDLAEFSIGSLSSSSTTNTVNNNTTTNTNQNNTAVFIGKQLTNRIYLSYGVGVFTGEQQGILTYALTPNIQLKGELTSFDAGGDIIYHTHSSD